LSEILARKHWSTNFNHRKFLRRPKTEH